MMLIDGLQSEAKESGVRTILLMILEFVPECQCCKGSPKNRLEQITWIQP